MLIFPYVCAFDTLIMITNLQTYSITCLLT